MATGSWYFLSFSGLTRQIHTTGVKTKAFRFAVWDKNGPSSDTSNFRLLFKTSERSVLSLLKLIIVSILFYARKIYVRTHVKITRQWKSTLTLINDGLPILRNLYVYALPFQTLPPFHNRTLKSGAYARKNYAPLEIYLVENSCVCVSFTRNHLNRAKFQRQNRGRFV